MEAKGVEVSMIRTFCTGEPYNHQSPAAKAEMRSRNFDFSAAKSLTC